MTRFFRQPWVKAVLSCLVVALFGFILLNLTFLFDFLFQSALRGLVGLFVQVGPAMELRWLPPVMHGAFVVLIGMISWLVFRTRLGVLYKATYLSVPVAVVLVTVGMFLYNWPTLSYAVGGVLCLGTLYWFYRTKQPWLYYFTVVLIGLVLAAFSLSGGEI